MSSSTANDKTILAADLAEARITGQETPAYDPIKKANAENIGHLSGDQTTEAETIKAPVGEHVAPDHHSKQPGSDFKTILAADLAEARITGHETPAYDPIKKANAENIGHLSGDQTTEAETIKAPVGQHVTPVHGK